MTNLEQIKIKLSNHETFYSIAYRHYVQTVQLTAERDQRPVKNDQDVDFVSEKNAAIQRSAMVVVVFSALTLEAFINHYGIERVSRSFFDNRLDKLDPVSKWLILPKLIVGRQLDTDGQAYELLKGLFKLRNKLVHYKTREKGIDELKDEDWVREEEAHSAIQAVNKLVEELKRLDPTVGTDWLREAETNPYA
jgi:hypothetical protein